MSAEFTIKKHGVREIYDSPLTIPVTPLPHSNAFRRWCHAHNTTIEKVADMVTDAVCRMPIDGHVVGVDRRMLARRLASYMYKRN